MNLVKLLLAFILLGSCTLQPSKINSEVFVHIDYGNNQVQRFSTSWRDGLSVLEALQHVKKIETHPVGKYVFVSAIDTVRGVKGKKAWYYQVNGKSANELAISATANPGDTIAWMYKADVCSNKVE